MGLSTTDRFFFHALDVGGLLSALNLFLLVDARQDLECLLMMKQCRTASLCLLALILPNIRSYFPLVLERILHSSNLLPAPAVHTWRILLIYLKLLNRFLMR